jgi:hypothetical protein
MTIQLWVRMQVEGLGFRVLGMRMCLWLVQMHFQDYVDWMDRGPCILFGDAPGFWM